LATVKYYRYYPQSASAAFKNIIFCWARSTSINAEGRFSGYGNSQQTGSYKLIYVRRIAASRPAPPHYRLLSRPGFGIDVWRLTEPADWSQGKPGKVGPLRSGCLFLRTKTQYQLSASLKQYTATIQLDGVIKTGPEGIGKLLDFYEQASQFEDCVIRVDCYDLKWIDANPAALLHAFDYQLLKLRNVQIVSDFSFLAERFCFLFENGWLKHGEKPFPDEQRRTLLCTSFAPDRLENFIDYVKKELLVHKGTHGLTEKLRIQMEADLMEIFINIDRHAQTKDPLFVCGHYYQAAGYFVFTMADLGVGFLPPIRTFTNGVITTCAAALDWALSGNSSTGEPLAGMGLEGIQNYCKNHGGGLQIISGDAFWGTKLPCAGQAGHIGLEKTFQGSIINLFFPFRATN
jgi:hypothetical protein